MKIEILNSKFDGKNSCDFMLYRSEIIWYNTIVFTYINFEEDNCGYNSKWSIYRVYE